MRRTLVLILSMSCNSQLVLGLSNTSAQNELDPDTNESNLTSPASPSVEDSMTSNVNAFVKDRSSPISDSMQPISIDFKGASIKDVLQALSKENQTNFVFPDDIGEKKVFISLKNTPWTQALNAILDTYGLGMIPLKGNVIRIDTLEHLNGEKKNIDQIRKNGSILQPTKVVIYRLSYASSEKVIKMVQEMLPALKYDDRVKVQSDERTNSVVVEATAPDLEKVRRIVEKIDLRTPQVKIDIRVLEVIKDVNKFLGINWGGPVRYDHSRGLGFGNLIFPNSVTSAFSVDTKAFNAKNGVAFDTHFGSLNNIFELDLRLRMAELSSYTRSLQNTNVTVLDNQAASIEAGSEQFFSVPVGLNDTRMSSVKSTLQLKVKPHITADGSIQMNIHINRDIPIDVADSSKASASKNITSLETDLLRKNGETAVIGGLYTTSIIRTETGVPFFSSIPILGALFKSKGTEELKRELMILVTPVILSAPDEKKQGNIATKESHKNTTGSEEAKNRKDNHLNISSSNSIDTNETENYKDSFDSLPPDNGAPSDEPLHSNRSNYSTEFDNLGDNNE